MRSVESISKRLIEAEKKSRQRTETSELFEYLSPAASLAQILTSLAIQTPERYEMTWEGGNKLPSASDAQKLRWLAPYRFHPERLDAIRQEWEESPHERDKLALHELDRLQPLMSL